MTVVLWTLLLPLLMNAQKTTPDSEHNDFSVISQQGSLFSLKIVRGKPMKIFVVGNEVAEMDISQIDLSAEFDPSDMSVSVRKVGNSSGSFFKIKKVKKHFEISEQFSTTTETVIEIKAKQKKKEETFKIKLAPLQ